MKTHVYFIFFSDILCALWYPVAFCKHGTSLLRCKPWPGSVTAQGLYNPILCMDTSVCICKCTHAHKYLPLYSVKNVIYQLFHNDDRRNL